MGCMHNGCADMKSLDMLPDVGFIELSLHLKKGKKESGNERSTSIPRNKTII